MSERIREPGQWTTDTVIDGAELEAFDDAQSNAIDGRGGAYTSEAPILVGGFGIEDCNVEHHVYSTATGNVTIGPTDAHRIRFFGASNINGTLVVLINDDGFGSRRTVYVSTLNFGSRVRIRDSANAVQFTNYTPAFTQNDVEITVERTEETGADAWRLVGISHRGNTTPLVDWVGSISSNPFALSKERFRVQSPVLTSKEIVLEVAANGSEKVIVIDELRADLTFSSDTPGNTAYVHDIDTKGTGFGVQFHFWRQNDTWVFGHWTEQTKDVAFSSQGSLGAGQVFTFLGTVSEYVVRVTTPVPSTSTESTVFLSDGAFAGQKFTIHNAGLGLTHFVRSVDNAIIATLILDAVRPATLQFIWNGTAWIYLGMLPYQIAYT